MSDPIVAAAAGSVAEVVAALEGRLAAQGIQLFAKIDHAAGARAAGLELADEVVLIFGSPAVGTALMQSATIAGLDLPLRMLIWDDGGRTRLAFHDPRDLDARYGLGSDATTLARLRGLLDALAAAVA